MLSLLNFLDLSIFPKNHCFSIHLLGGSGQPWRNAWKKHALRWVSQPWMLHWRSKKNMPSKMRFPNSLFVFPLTLPETNIFRPWKWMVGIRGRFLLGFGLLAQELDLEEADLAQLRIEVGGWCLRVTKGWWPVNQPPWLFNQPPRATYPPQK